MDASYKIQRGIHVHLIQFFMCPEFWVHINMGFWAAITVTGLIVILMNVVFWTRKRFHSYGDSL